MKTKTTTRRAILAGAATALASTGIGIGVVRTKAAESDPIYAAIERHKVAFRISHAKSRILSNTTSAEWAPDYDPVEWGAVKEAHTAACNASAAAANALTTVRPSTMAGVLALVCYVEAFNGGAFFLEPDSSEATSDDWRSAPMHWPETKDDDEVDLFGFAILANVRCALEAIAVQS
jgi:hypothetical protein